MLVVEIRCNKSLWKLRNFLFLLIVPKSVSKDVVLRIGEKIYVFL